MLDIKIKGQLLAAHSDTFQDDKGVDVVYGKCQVLQCMDNGFYQLTNIKVSPDDLGFLPSWQPLIGKEVDMPLSQRTYTPPAKNGFQPKTQINHYLSAPFKETKKAA